MKMLAWVCLLLYGFFLCGPFLSVWADQLPYQQPTYQEYRPNPKPIIPKGIKLKQSKPKATKPEQEEGLDFWSPGNLGIYTQVGWNIIGDVIPAAYGRAYVQKYRLMYIFKTNGRGDLRIGGRKQIPYWLTRWRWLDKSDWTIGKFHLGKWLYNRINGYHLRLMEYGFVDLVRGKRYTQQELNETLYMKNERAFHPQMGAGEIVKKGWTETKNVLTEAFWVSKESVKKVSWWKLTGKVGVGFSAVITFLDYVVDPNKHVVSPEFVAALPLDFAIGVGVATVSAPIGVFAATVLAAVGGVTFAAIAGVVATLVIAFALGYAVENISIFKNAKDWVHKKLTAAIVKGATVTKEFSKKTINKTVSICKSTTNWIAKKLGI